MRKFVHTYEDIISVENLLLAWKEFVCGKKNKKDVQEFQYRLMDNVFSLHRELKDKTYIHGDYHAFNISDPKPRNIHKASVKDRLLHHAVYRVLYPYFDKIFIYDSYSCRIGKGTHRALERFLSFGNKVSKNHTKQCWVLKCDIRKFFASIDHDILKKILATHIRDEGVLWLLGRVVDSFDSGSPRRGLPLGNLTSQLLVNIYMNEFDQWAKHTLKAKYYIRYADDFVFFSHDKTALVTTLRLTVRSLRDVLKLNVHPKKVFLKTLSSGVDFLGWVHFSDHRVLRTTTKKRMLKNLNEKNQTSYFGLLRHGNAYNLKRVITVLYTHQTWK